MAPLILLVEDNETNQMLALAVLQRDVATLRAAITAA